MCRSAWLLMALVGLPLAQAADPQWTFLTDTQIPNPWLPPQSGKVYVDVASIHQESAWRTVSSRLVLDQPQMSVRRMAIKEYREQWLADCAQNTLGLVRQEYLDEAGHTLGAKEKSAETRQFASPPTDTHHRQLLGFVCSHKLEAQAPTPDKPAETASGS
jgi:hypothetical protein